jgi:hypothetical protein
LSRDGGRSKTRLARHKIDAARVRPNHTGFVNPLVMV